MDDVNDAPLRAFFGLGFELDLGAFHLLVRQLCGHETGRILGVEGGRNRGLHLFRVECYPHICATVAILDTLRKSGPVVARFFQFGHDFFALLAVEQLPRLETGLQGHAAIQADVLQGVVGRVRCGEICGALD